MGISTSRIRIEHAGGERPGLSPLGSMTGISDDAALWDGRYSAEGYLYGTEPNDFLVEVIAGVEPGSALCLAEGEGRNAVYLAGLGFEVTAVDHSVEGGRKTRALARERGVEVKVVTSDLAEYDLGADRWDLIVSIFAHLPPAARTDVFMRLPRALAPGGTLILEAYRPEQAGRDTGGPPDPTRLYDLATLEREIVGLDIVLARETEREVIEGRGHTGAGAVVQLIARRRAAWQHLS